MESLKRVELRDIGNANQSVTDITQTMTTIHDEPSPPLIPSRIILDPKQFNKGEEVIL